jgi:hypothetical protein
LKASSISPGEIVGYYLETGHNQLIPVYFMLQTQYLFEVSLEEQDFILGPHKK